MLTQRWRDELDRLRVELIEQACALDRRGQHEAADVAVTTAVRLAEIADGCPLVSREGVCLADAEPPAPRPACNATGAPRSR